jgi:hypothetical protein
MWPIYGTMRSLTDTIWSLYYTKWPIYGTIRSLTDKIWSLYWTIWSLTVPVLLIVRIKIYYFKYKSVGRKSTFEILNELDVYNISRIQCKNASQFYTCFYVVVRQNILSQASGRAESLREKRYHVQAGREREWEIMGWLTGHLGVKPWTCDPQTPAVISM